MKVISAPLVLSTAFVLASCANRPELRPIVGDRELSPRAISPGDTVLVSFSLEVEDASAVKRIYLRGLPENTLAADTRVELPLPEQRPTNYRSPIQVRIPAADGHCNVVLVFETTGKTDVAQLISLAVRDTPRRILHSQFQPGSHAAADCALGTKLLTFEYAVADGNRASGFVAPTLSVIEEGSNDFVFFPHWRPITWLGGKLGIVFGPRQRMTLAGARKHLPTLRDAILVFERTGDAPPPVPTPAT